MPFLSLIIYNLEYFFSESNLNERLQVTKKIVSCYSKLKRFETLTFKFYLHFYVLQYLKLKRYFCFFSLI